MTTHRFSPDEIVAKFLLARQLEAKGAPLAVVCRQLQVTKLTYLRWCKKFEWLDKISVSRLRRLEQENASLRAARPH